jgi:Domain of unknown function (DUF4920)
MADATPVTLVSRQPRTCLTLVLALAALSAAAGCKRSLAPPTPVAAASASAPQAEPSASVPMTPAPSAEVTSTEPVAGATPSRHLGDHGHFGAAFTGAKAQKLKDLAAQPEQFKDQTLTVSGVVRRVCERKGCWMELATSAAAEAASCRIRFKDYGFFVPIDSKGANAKIEGVLMVNNVSKARVEHLEQEGAVFESKNADGSANETQLIASAVELTR